MKLRNLLILSAALLGSGAAQAELVDGVRQKPVPATSELQFDATMYLYNTEAKGYFLGANDWSTRASLGDTGWKVKISKHIDVTTGTWDEKTVVLKDSVENGSNTGWRMAWFTTDAVETAGFGSIYTDWVSQPDTLWTLTQVNGAYRLAVSDGNAFANFTNFGADMYVGQNDTLEGGGNTRLWANLKDCAEHSIDWGFVLPADYDAHAKAVEIYNVAQTLKGFIDEAKEKGLDVAAQEAVYANEAADSAQVADALVAVKAALAAYEEQNVDPNNPIDKTSMIVNANYENGKADWTDTNSDWAVNYSCAEHYDDLFDHYQVIKGMPKGVYAVTVRGYIRTASAATAWDRYNNGTRDLVKLYAATATDTLTGTLPNIWAGKSEAALGVGSTSTATDAAGTTWYVTNNMQGAEAYFNHETYGPQYDATVFFGIEADSVQIGLKLDSLVGDDWVLWDNWRLTYYGVKPEAWSMWVENMKTNAPVFDAEDALVTAGMIDAYNATVAALAGNDRATAVAAMNTLNAEIAKVEENMEAWKTFNTWVEKANLMGSSGSFDGENNDALGDYVLDAEDIVDELALTTEELKAEIEKIQAMIQATMVELIVGEECTEFFIGNYDFENTTDGKSDGKDWEGDWTAFGGPANNKCMEAYEKTWDVYQTVTGVPAGIYEVSLQGFYRVARGSDAWTSYQNGGQTCPGSVYLNNNETPLKCVFDESVKATENIYSGTTTETEGNFCRFLDPAGTGDSLCFPNDMTSAGEAFAAGMYQAAANGLVAENGGTLRVGTKGTKQSATWVIWDNFKMTYWGKRAHKIEPHLTTAIANGEANLEKRMSKTAKAMVQAAVDGGKAALTNGADAIANEEDSEEMFAALVALYASNEGVASSVALMDSLMQAAEGLLAEIDYAPASDDVKAEVTVAISDIMDAVDACTLEDEEARAKGHELRVLRTKLYIVPGPVSDDEPGDYTLAIMTPDFEDEGVNSVEGWAYDTYSFGTQSVFAVEFYQTKFDINQTIYGLPDGTYRVEVSGFHRNGSTKEDYTEWLETPDANEAVLYASCGENYYATPLAHLADCINQTAGEDKGVAGTATIQDAAGNNIVLPNNMESVSAYFELECYKNSIYVLVKDGAPLTIGVKKEEADSYSNDWAMIDHWKLYYHGTESNSVEENVADAAVEVVKVEIFNLNGVQLSKMQKGLNIVKTTLANGKVAVKKVLVK